MMELSFQMMKQQNRNGQTSIIILKTIRNWIIIPDIQLSKVTVPRGRSSLSAYVYVPENLNTFKKDVTLKNRVTGEIYQLTDDGAAISEKTAELLDLKVGDELTIKKDDAEYKAKIAVITENYAGHYIYMTPKVYRETFGEDPDYADIVFYCKRSI